MGTCVRDLAGLGVRTPSPCGRHWQPHDRARGSPPDLDFVSLSDALELVLLLVDDPRRFRRAALRWHARYCGGFPDVGFDEAHADLACLAGLTGQRPKAAAHALAELVARPELR